MDKFKMILGLFAFVVMVGCTPTSLTILEIEVDSSQVPIDVTTDSFDIDMLVLRVTMSDQSIVDYPISESMMSVEDFNKLSLAGEHYITISYEGHETSFILVLAEVKEIVSVTFMNDLGVIVLEVVLDKGEALPNVPEVPEKEGYNGVWDWNDFSSIDSDLVVTAVYTFIEKEELETIIALLDLEYEDKTVNSDIVFTPSINGATIVWKSESPLFLSDSGEFMRPYESTSIKVIADIIFKEEITTKEYTFLLEGYRSLDNNIASGYVYRGYNSLSIEFFNTMDIIYCAFVLMDVNGGFTGVGSNGISVASTNSTYLNNMTKYVIPKAKEKGIYAIASLGGGGTVPKETFSIVAASDSLRKAFAQSAVKLINDYGFDGVDIDWETPTTNEKENFKALMQEVYTAVKANNPHHLVTAAITGGMWQPPRYDLPNSIQYLDFINVMTYGMTNNGGYYQNALFSSRNAHNTALGVGRTLTSCSIDESVVIFNNLNVPSSKLIIGLAFYGIRHNYNNGNWSSGGSVHYNTLKSSYLSSPNYTYVYDETAQVPYLISNNGLTFISFDDPRSILAKCQYVKDNNLAGVMYWENGCDLTGDLVNAINQGLKQ